MDIAGILSIVILGLGCLSLGVLAIFVGASYTNTRITGILDGSFVDRSGAFHFLALSLGAILTGYFVSLVRRFSFSRIQSLIVFVTPMFFLALIHLWELLVESWKIIHVNSEFGETVEVVFWIPVLCSILIGAVMYRLSGSTSLSVKVQTKEAV